MRSRRTPSDQLRNGRRPAVGPVFVASLRCGRWWGVRSPPSRLGEPRAMASVLGVAVGRPLEAVRSAVPTNVSAANIEAIVNARAGCSRRSEADDAAHLVSQRITSRRPVCANTSLVNP